MSNATPRHPITLKRLLRHIDGMDHLPVRRDVPYYASAAGPLTLDVYYPSGGPGAAIAPAVIIACGYPDIGVPLALGCQFKEMAFVVSTAQLIAATGMAAIAYTTSDPAADASRVVTYLEEHGRALHVDATRVGVWAASGNGPVALSLVMQKRRGVRAAVLSNCYTIDIAGSAVADAAALYRFAHATAGRSPADLPPDVPLFIVRSGRDEFAGLNAALDRFVAEAIGHGVPLTLVNHATAPHAFELSDDSPRSRYIVDAMLVFLERHLRAV
jgi:hypothetical protein